MQKTFKSIQTVPSLKPLCAIFLGFYASMALAQEPAQLEMITLNDAGLMPAEGKANSGKAAAMSANKNATSLAKHVEQQHAHVVLADKAKVALVPTRASGVVATYKVKEGDNLDKVVHQIWPDSLLNPEVLKQAIVDMNPNAMTHGTRKMLMSGVTIQLPNERDILEKRLNKIAPNPVHQEADLKGYTSYPDQAYNPEGAEKRRQWVSFP